MKSSIVFLILLTSCLIFSGNANAQAPLPNFVTSLGTFDYVYNDTLGYGELSIVFGDISSVAHADGGIGLDNCPFFITNCSVDPIYGGSVSTVIYNNSGGSWTFAPTDPSGDEFTVKDIYGVTRLTADISQFTVDSSSFEVNSGFDEGNVGPINTFSGVTSEFMDDVNSFSPPWGELLLSFNFTGTGPSNFTANTSGTITSTFAVVPEPISSVLFITGGATLALRRYRSRKIAKS